MNDREILHPFLLALLAIVVPNLRPREGLNWCETSDGLEVWLGTEEPVTVSLTLRQEQLIADPIRLGIEVAEELLRCLREPLRFTLRPHGLELRVEAADQEAESPLPRIRPCRNPSGTRFEGPVPGRMEPESAP